MYSLDRCDIVELMLSQIAEVVVLPRASGEAKQDRHSEAPKAGHAHGHLDNDTGWRW
jgi:hypothetical protein